MTIQVHKTVRNGRIEYNTDEEINYNIYKIICEDNAKYEVGEKMPNKECVSSIEICMETRSFRVFYGDMTIDIPSSRIVRWFSKKE